MPQGRILLKSICESRKLAYLNSDMARLLYTWLIPNLDVNGCFSGDAEVVKGKIFTRLKKTTEEVESCLKDLEKELIIRYKVNGDWYLCVPDFVKKQPSINPKREGLPTIPPPSPELLKRRSGVAPEMLNTSKVKISKVKESKVSSNSGATPDQGLNKKTSSQDLALILNKLTLQFQDKIEKLFGPLNKIEQKTFANIRMFLLDTRDPGALKSAMKFAGDAKSWADHYEKGNVAAKKYFVSLIKKNFNYGRKA